MSKVRIAAVSPLLVACLCGFPKQASALLAAAGLVCRLAFVLFRTETGRLGRKAMAWAGFRGQRLLRCALPGALVMVLPSLGWATFPTSFRGVTAPLPTPGLTLSAPWAVALDSQGDVFIADTLNSRVVEVTAAGVASVVAFPGLSPALSNPSAVAVDGSGNLYVADSAVPRVVELSAGVATVVPTASLLSSPTGLAVDAAGDLFIADQTHDYIVKVPAGGTAAVFPISGIAPGQPWGLAADVAGNLYVADETTNRIVVVTPGGAGSVLPIIGGLTLSQPTGVAVDGLGNVYIGDTGNSRVVTVDSSGDPTVLFTNGVTPVNPKGVAVSPMGAVYFADSGNNQVVYAQPTTVNFGHLALGAGTSTTLVLPFTIGFGVTFGSLQAYTTGAAGLDFTVASTTCDGGVTTNGACTATVTFLPGAAGLRRGEIVVYDNSAAPIISVPLYAVSDGPLATLSPGTASLISTGVVTTAEPFQIAFDGSGNFYIGDYSGSNVLEVPPGGGSATVVTTGGITLGEVAGVALDGAGNLFISDHSNADIVEVTPGGTASMLNLSSLSPALYEPTGLAVDAAGNLYISDYGNGRVVKVTPAGVALVVGTGSFTPADQSVVAVAVDSAGTIYFPDSLNNRVIKVTAAGAASLVVPAGITPVLSSPSGVAIDAFDNLYIGDIGNQRIVEATAAGLASVVPTPGLVGPTTLGSYYTITVDPLGNLLIPDFSFNRLVKVNVAGATLAFPNTNVGSSSSAETASVTNLGNLPLVFALSPGYTANFSQPSGATGQCLIATSVAAGMACDVSLVFTPQTAGPLSASIVLTNNNLNVADATENVAVSGTGVVVADTTATTVSTVPTSIIFGQTITITAVVTDTAAGHTGIVPTGGVTFTDTVGSTVISLNGGNPVTLNGSGDAILSGVTLSGVGLHTITANYQGVSGVFATSSNTTTIAVSADSTTTTLIILPGASIAAGTVATLRATVTSGGTPGVPGTVVFCDATAAHCTGRAILGSAQLTSAGSATIELTLGAGTYSIAAEFQATSTTLASVSAAQTLTVTGTASYLSYTAIADAGVAGDYTLTGTVTAFGKIVPTGTVSFLDATNGNAVVASAALNPSSLGFNFLSAAGSPLGVGSFPIATVLGDFNNDGKLDLAMVNYGGQTVSVALGNGDGAFQTPVTFAVGLAPTGIALGDFNHDGNLDLAVTNYEADNVSILLGNGNGTFAAQVTYATAHRPSGIVVADFNGDGNLDLAIADTFGTAVTVLLGHGDGTFVADSPASFAVGINPIGIATADFNGDGNADLAVANANDGTVSVLLGHGDGTFQSQIVIPVNAANEVSAVAVGDFNGDGVPDIVLPDNEGSQVFVLLGINGLTFQPPVAYNAGTAGSGEFGIAIADFRGTGNLDIAVTNAGDGTVSLLRNTGGGSGTFLTEVSFPVGGEPWGAAAGDLNGDGLPDLVTANYGGNTASILLSAQTETAIATGVAVYGTGTHNVFASYPGDADRAPSVSSNVALAGTPLTVTVTTLVAAPNPSVTGQSVTLTATITPSPTGSSLGSVNFYNGATLLGMGTVNSSGIASFTTTTLPAGALTLTAIYSGNLSSAASTSAAFVETVTTSTVTTLVAVPNPAIVGQSVTLTATITPTPTGSTLGSISFYNGAALLGVGTVNSSGIATFTSSSLPVGSLILTAVYSGNAGFDASTSAAFHETVNGVATATALIAAPNPTVAGQAVALTATVVPAPAGSTLGSISFYDGATLLGSGTLNSSGIATFATSSLPVGDLSLTAVYSGNAGFAASTSAAFAETVAAASVPTTTVLNGSPNPQYDGQPFTLTVTVHPAPTVNPAGIISFYDGTNLLGTGTLNTSGVAMFTTSSLAVGVDSLSAVYPGSPGFASSTSTLSELVNTAYTITGPSAPVLIAPGGSVMINLNVPPLGGAFNNIVTLSASGLPAGATAAFNPSKVTPGAEGAATVMTVDLAMLTASDSSRSFPRPNRKLPVAPFTLAFVLFGIASGGRLGRKRVSKGMAWMILLTGLTVATSGLTGCGGGFSNAPFTKAGNYVVTVTGTSGSFQASTTVTLTVK